MKILLSHLDSSVSVPQPSMAVVEYVAKGRPDISHEDSKCLLTHIRALRMLIKSRSSSAIIWDDDILVPICRFTSLSKRLLSQTSPDIIVLSASNPGLGDDDDYDLDALNLRKAVRGNLPQGIRAYWISRDHAFRCLAIFDRPFYSIAPSPLSADRFLDLGEHVSIVAPSLFYLKDSRPYTNGFRLSRSDLP